MNGWELKPLGALVVFALLILFLYIGYRIAMYWQPPSPL